MLGDEAEEGATGGSKSTYTRTAMKKRRFQPPPTVNAARGKPGTERKAWTEPIAPETAGRRLAAAAAAAAAAAVAARRSGIVRQIPGKIF